jgi:hypothetical protein
VLLTCESGNRAYIFVPDLTIKGPPNAAAAFVPGISDTGPGQEGYGTARDLTEQASAMEKEKRTAKQ